MIIGILTFAGTYMILSKNLIRIVLGTAIYTHVANLVILAMSGFNGKMYRLSMVKGATL